MAPIKNTPKPLPQKTNVGEQVLDLVIPYIHSVEDRSSVSLVSRKCYETDGITRKCVTVQAYYYPNPASLCKRFPFIESLTLKGPPPLLYNRDGYAIRITPWIEQLALDCMSLKELCIRNLVVLDKDLETLARTRGKDLRTLKIKKCKGYSSDGLRHVSRYCNQLRTLSLEFSYYIAVSDGIWLHELASNSTVLERLHVSKTDLSYAEDLTILAKNCCNSLISLKIGACYLSKLGDAFRYALRLEHFGGDIWDEESGLVGFRFPPNTRSFNIQDFPVTRFSTVLPFLNHIKKLKLGFIEFDAECQCLLFKRCPNLEVLSTEDVCGDAGLQVIGKFCKKLRKLNHKGVGVVTHLGVIAVATGCTNLESLEVSLSDISNEALECVGTHLKNLCKFRMDLVKKVGTKDLLDNGIRAMLMGCSKLERLDISLRGGGLTDVGFEYIGEYGANLRSLSLTRTGMSNAGLVKFSKGCPRLRKLKLCDFPVSKQAVASSVFNLPSLRYVWGYSSDLTTLALTRPDSQLQKHRKEQVEKEVSK